MVVHDPWSTKLFYLYNVFKEVCDDTDEYTHTR